MADDAKEKLVRFLDYKAFDPVLRADPQSYPQDKRSMLEDVQEATRKEKDRFHHYGSAREVYDMFKGDLSSEPAQKVHSKLHSLDLPTLNDCRDEFEKLAEEVGAR